MTKRTLSVNSSGNRFIANGVGVDQVKPKTFCHLLSSFHRSLQGGGLGAVAFQVVSGEIMTDVLKLGIHLGGGLNAQRNRAHLFRFRFWEAQQIVGSRSKRLLREAIRLQGPPSMFPAWTLLFHRPQRESKKSRWNCHSTALFESHFLHQY